MRLRKAARSFRCSVERSNPTLTPSLTRRGEDRGLNLAGVILKGSTEERPPLTKVKDTARFNDPLDVVGGLRTVFRARIADISDTKLTAMRREFAVVLREWLREMDARQLAARAWTLPFNLPVIGLEAALTRARSPFNAARQEIGDFGLWLLMVQELNPALLSLGTKHGHSRIMAMVIHDTLHRMDQDEALYVCGIMLKARAPGGSLEAVRLAILDAQRQRMDAVLGAGRASGRQAQKANATKSNQQIRQIYREYLSTHPNATNAEGLTYLERERFQRRVGKPPYTRSTLQKMVRGVFRSVRRAAKTGKRKT
jgi:hypothetical protein